MPCFNAAVHITRSVASALGQTFHDIELIVVNDGSTDKSLEVLKRIADPRLKIINQLNQGVSAARNRGLKEARGDYIAFLDADDTWHPECLEKLHASLSSHPSAALVYCGWQNLGLSGGQGKPYVPSDYEGPEKIEKLLQACPWPIHAALTRKEKILETGGFDEKLSNSEDYRLWLHIAARNKIVRVPQMLAYYHFHEGPQATKNRAKGARSNWRVKKEFLQKNPGVAKQLDKKILRQCLKGMLLRKGYECYWDRDLAEARQIFRLVMKTGFGSFKDWKYMLPSLLPISVHRNLICVLERKK